MSDNPNLQILIAIKEQLVAMNTKLDTINMGLSTDRSNIWKVLLLTIGGAFALIGIKLVLP